MTHVFEYKITSGKTEHVLYAETVTIFSSSGSFSPFHKRKEADERIPSIKAYMHFQSAQHQALHNMQCIAPNFSIERKSSYPSYHHKQDAPLYPSCLNYRLPHRYPINHTLSICLEVDTRSNNVLNPPYYVM
jgi:hypothetical protein